MKTIAQFNTRSSSHCLEPSWVSSQFTGSTKYALDLLLQGHSCAVSEYLLQTVTMIELIRQMGGVLATIKYNRHIYLFIYF